MLLQECCEITAPKTLEISRKSYAGKLYFNNSTKNFTTDTFLEMFRKLKPLFVCKTFVPFSPTSETCSSKFATSGKTDSDENISCEYSEILK